MHRHKDSSSLCPYQPPNKYQIHALNDTNVNKNGLVNRSRERKVSIWVMSISGFFLVSFFLVPLINQSGSIPEMSGRANAIDYATIDGWGSWGKEHELFAQVKEFELSTVRMIDHYKKCTGLKEKEIREYLLPPEDKWLSAREAKKLGICDSVKSVY